MLRGAKAERGVSLKTNLKAIAIVSFLSWKCFGSLCYELLVFNHVPFSEVLASTLKPDLNYNPKFDAPKTTKILLRDFFIKRGLQTMKLSFLHPRHGGVSANKEYQEAFYKVNQTLLKYKKESTLSVVDGFDPSGRLRKGLRSLANGSGCLITGVGRPLTGMVWFAAFGPHSGVGSNKEDSAIAVAVIGGLATITSAGYLLHAAGAVDFMKVLASQMVSQIETLFNGNPQISRFNVAVVISPNLPVLSPFSFNRIEFANRVLAKMTKKGWSVSADYEKAFY